MTKHLGGEARTHGGDAMAAVVMREQVCKSLNECGPALGCADDSSGLGFPWATILADDRRLFRRRLLRLGGRQPGLLRV